MRLSRALAALLGVLCALPCSAAVASVPVRFAVQFADAVHLGGRTSIALDVHVGAALAPVTEVRLLTPQGLTLADSRLGAAECRRPQVEVTRVMGPVRHGRCPVNSLLAIGTATAGLLLSDEETLFGAAVIEMHAGAPVGDKPGLLVMADTYHPVRIQLTYAGYLYVPPAPFELGMAVMLPALPSPPFGAPVALSTLRLVVGGPSIQYHRWAHGRRTWYRPGGIPLPKSCPRGGFRFRAILRFADATRRSIDAVVPCPAGRQ
jgi:hypothetical protein